MDQEHTLDTLGYTLTLTSDVSWTIVYLAIIYRSFQDKVCGMPFFALALNLTWMTSVAGPEVLSGTSRRAPATNEELPEPRSPGGSLLRRAPGQGR